MGAAGLSVLAALAAGAVLSSVRVGARSPLAFRGTPDDARTLQQDAAFGIWQLVDVACKALSPAVNDPYTAVQAVDHLSVIFCTLARRPLGAHVARDGRGV